MLVEDVAKNMPKPNLKQAKFVHEEIVKKINRVSNRKTMNHRASQLQSYLFHKIARLVSTQHLRNRPQGIFHLNL